jgi:hypothetical protein
MRSDFHCNLKNQVNRRTIIQSPVETGNEQQNDNTDEKPI